MALIERREAGAAAIEDRFTKVDDEAALPAGGGVIVSLSRFEGEKEALLARDGELGVALESSESPAALANDLDRLAVVALDFPAFSDGRGFSSARLLRERYGYKGELRATGDVLLEQLAFMVRSGFNTFEIDDPKVLEEFAHVVGEVRVVYQPTGDGQTTALQRRLRSG
ncbi:MAG: oxidoreductase [Deltaproteobacteria bacterium]|nr:oxidoreductase [Deltaproteobacteria bacterium]